MRHQAVVLLAASAFLSQSEPSLLAATPAQGRVTSAAQLQRTFDSSVLKNMDLRVIVRGSNCDVLQVEALNLYPEMMESLANGTVIYGKVVPGGVNSYGFNRGFRDVFYSNRDDKEFRVYGASKLTRDKALKLKACTDAIAASITAGGPAGPVPTAAPFEPLSWAAASPGQKLYNASYKHEATIVSVDKPAGLITVRYLNTGATEPKRLDAVAGAWYVKK